MTIEKDEKIIDLDPDQVVDNDKAPKSGASAPKPKSRSKMPWLAISALVLGIFGGGWLYRDVLSSYLPSNEMAQVIAKADAMETGNASLREQIATLDRLAAQFKTDIDALEASISTTNSNAKAAGEAMQSVTARAERSDAALADVKTSLAALQKSITDLQSNPPFGSNQVAAPPVDLSAILKRLDNLEKDVASLKTGDGKASPDTAALTQSLSDLKAKFAAGAPFADELSRLQRMAPAAPGLDDLSRHAAAGIPDGVALAASLKTIAPTLKPAENSATASADESWSGWAADLLSDIITIRNAGDADWVKTAEAAAAFAESGDLPQAISHISEAEGSKPAALQQWLETAQARVAMETALTGVEAAVLRILASKS